MSLTLYFHPLASACWKVLVALYENDTPFRARQIDLGDPAQRAELAALWPLAKFPVLVDAAREQVLPETSIIIDYVAQHYPGPVELVPEDRDRARRIRLADRFYDFYVHDPMQRIVADRLRPENARDAYGVQQLRALLETAYGIIDRDLQQQRWAAGDAFSLADCAAAPALYYADRVLPIAATYPHTREYLQRLLARPSFARVLREAEPYFAMFPG
jgi:glutathione S-transferase